MNTIRRVFKKPWLASVHSTLTGYTAVIAWLPLLAVYLSDMRTHGTTRRLSVLALILALALVWKMVADTLWLARDARDLRLPGVEGDADFTLLLFAIASVMLPAVILGAVFGHLVAWLLSLALVSASTLAFCVLPGALVLPVFVVGAFTVPSGEWKPPLPTDPAFPGWAIPVLIVLTVASLQRWIAVRRAVTLELKPWLRPTASTWRLLQLRRLRGGSYRATDFGREGKRHMASASRLNKVGPDHPIRSIRAALHPLMVPTDLSGGPDRVARVRLLLVASVLIWPALAWMAGEYFGLPITAHASSPLLWMILTGTTIPVSINKDFAASWSQQRGGLPLLALLPHLDPPTRLKRDTIIACVARAGLVKLWFAAGALLSLWVLRLPLMFYVYVVLMLACGMLLEIAITGHFLAGSWSHWRGIGLYFLTILVPGDLTVYWDVRETAGMPPHLATPGWPAVGCVAVWLLWCAGFALLALHGWRLLQRRPHPFLTNT